MNKASILTRTCKNAQLVLKKKVEVPDKSSKSDLDNGNQYVKVVVHVPGI